MKKDKKKIQLEKDELPNPIEWKGLAIIIFLVSILLFLNISDRSLGHDEIDTAKFTTNLESCSYPYNQPCTEDTVFNVSNAPNLFPRMTYYVAFLTSKMTNDFEFNYRFPFIIIGLMSIVTFYFFSRELFKKKALFCTVLYSFSIIFILHARQSRYYTLIFLFSILSYLFWYRYVKNNTLNPLKYPFAIIALCLLFYAHVQIFFYVAGSLFFWGILNKRIKGSIIQFATIAVIIAPAMYLWLIKWNIPSGKGNMIHFFLDPSALIFNFGVTLFYLFIFLIPVFLLLFIPYKTKETKYLVYLIITLTIFMSLITHNALPELRKYVSITFAPATILCAMAIENLFNNKKLASLNSLTLKIIKYSFIAIFLATNIFFVILLMPLKIGIGYTNLDNPEIDSGRYFFDKALEPRFVAKEFGYELTHHYNSAIEEVSKHRNVLENKKVYSEISEDAMLVYIPKAKIVHNKEEADVLILKDPSETLKNEYLDNNEYNLISEIKIKYSQWEGAPDIIHHQFMQNTGGSIIILDKN